MLLFSNFIKLIFINNSKYYVIDTCNFDSWVSKISQMISKLTYTTRDESDNDQLSVINKIGILCSIKFSKIFFIFTYLLLNRNSKRSIITLSKSDKARKI